MEERALPVAQLRPRRVRGHVVAAIGGVARWFEGRWRALQPRALVLSLTALGVATVLGMTWLIAESTGPAHAAPRASGVVYLMRAPRIAPAPVVADVDTAVSPRGPAGDGVIAAP